MRKFIYDSWNSVMDHNYNPLRHIPDLNVRHMAMQILAWMWCVAFSMWFGSMWIFGLTTMIHIILIVAIVLTVAAFETAKRNPNYFDHWYSKPGLGRGNGGEHE